MELAPLDTHPPARARGAQWRSPLVRAASRLRAPWGPMVAHCSQLVCYNSSVSAPCAEAGLCSNRRVSDLEALCAPPTAMVDVHVFSLYLLGRAISSCGDAAPAPCDGLHPGVHGHPRGMDPTSAPCAQDTVCNVVFIVACIHFNRRATTCSASHGRLTHGDCAFSRSLSRERELRPRNSCARFG